MSRTPQLEIRHSALAIRHSSGWADAAETYNHFVDTCCFLLGILDFAALWVTSELLLLLISLEQNSARTVRLLQTRR